MSKAVKFINWTNEDFACKWDGSEIRVKARESIWMQDWKADHCAKHLTDRELHKKGFTTDHFSRPELLKKCITDAGVEVQNEDSLETELLNKNISLDDIKKKPGRPKKIEQEINPAFSE